MARRNLAEVLAGIVVLLVAAGFLAFALARGSVGTVAGYTLDAKFDRIDGLSVGADVRMAGVKIGTVTGAQIDPKTYLAIVRMSVRNGTLVPKDSSAAITSDGLLGSEYLALSPGGSATMLKPGQEIAITQSPVNLQQLLGKFIFSVTDLVGAMKKQGGTAGK